MRAWVCSRLGLVFNVLPGKVFGLNYTERIGDHHVSTTSPFTATAWEIGHDINHLSIGDFFLTPERSVWTEFIAPYKTEVFTLITQDEDRHFTWEHVLKLGQPFEPAVWLFIVLQLVVFTLFYYAIEVQVCISSACILRICCTVWII